MTKRIGGSPLNLIFTFILGAAIGFTACYALFFANPSLNSKTAGLLDSVNPFADTPGTPSVEDASAPEPTEPPGPEARSASPVQDTSAPAQPSARDATPTGTAPPGDEPGPSGLEQFEDTWPARHFFVSVKGTSLTPVERSFFATAKPGGVLLRGDNCRTPGQIKALVKEIKDAVGLGTSADSLPLIAVDQEGGPVNPLNLDNAPSAADLGASADLDKATDAGRVAAEACRQAGIAVMFAPVLDINEDGVLSNLDERSFGEDHLKVAALGMAFAHGVTEGGALPVAKHFPGLGGVRQSMLESLPTLSRDLDGVVEGVFPFSEAIRCRIPGIMVTHVAVPVLDPNEDVPRPASLSPLLVTSAIRNELEYDGVVVTDNLNMAAVTVDRSLEEAAVEALGAGCDAMVIVDAGVERLQAVCKAIEQAVMDGSLDADALSESKSRLGAWQAWVREPAGLRGPLPSLPAEASDTPATEDADTEPPEPEPEEPKADKPNPDEAKPETAAKPEPARAPADKEAVQPPNTKKVLYEIQRGDTLLRVARKYNVPPSDIVKWNKLKDRNDIKWGLKLIVYVPE